MFPSRRELFTKSSAIGPNFQNEACFDGLPDYCYSERNTHATAAYQSASSVITGLQPGSEKKNGVELETMSLVKQKRAHGEKGIRKRSEDKYEKGP